MKYLVIIILFIFSTPAKAAFHVGSSVIVLGNHNLSPTYNLGYSKLFDNDLTLGIVSNVLFPTEDTLRKKGFKVEYKTTYLSILVGHKLNTRTVLSFMVSGVKVDNSVYLGNTNISREKIHTVVWGGNLNYYFTDKIAGSLSVVSDKAKIGLKDSLIIGINVYF